MHVRDVLKVKSRGVFTIPPEASVSEAIALLAQHNIGSLPVVDAQGRLVGIFTERDVLLGIHRDCEAFNRARIQDVMTPSPVTCTPDDEVHYVMGRMGEHHVGQLPVMGSDGELVGVVSVGDVIKHLNEKVENENRHLINYIYGPA